MTYKTILVHLDGRARNAERLDFAFGIAAKFEAHLVGLYAPGVARIPSYALAEAGPTLRELVEQRRAGGCRGARGLSCRSCSFPSLAHAAAGPAPSGARAGCRRSSPRR